MTDHSATRRQRPRLDAGAKARLAAEIAQLDARAAPPAPPAPPAPNLAKALRDNTPRDIWPDLATFHVDEPALEANFVVTAARIDPAYSAFDILRTRLLHAVRDNGWSRVGITSPTQGCGKTFVAANLGIGLSRYESLRVVLLDMDLRRPTLHNVLGVREAPSAGEFLRGNLAPAQYLQRPGQNMLNIGHSLAVGFNGHAEPYAAELFHAPSAGAAISRMMDETRADLVLYDMPPALAIDDVIAFRPHFDGVLIVAGGGVTTAREMKETVRRLGEEKPVIGVILNRGQGEGTQDFTY